MPRFFVKTEQIQDETITILGEDVKHIKNVLRQKIGDKITICNNDTLQDYECEISKIEENKICCDIKETLNTSSESNVKVTIFQGLPKADKMELVIQKSVELGVFDITPVEMKRCVVKLKENDKKKKIERWQKIAEVAAKQSGRNQIPKINDIIQIKNICLEMEKYDIVLVAYEKEENNTLKQVLKQLKVIYPEITNMNSTMYNTYSYIYIMNSVNIGDCINSSVYSAISSSSLLILPPQFL